MATRRFTLAQIHDLPTLWIEERKITSKIRRIANEFFQHLVEGGYLGGYKLTDKRKFLQLLMDALKRAWYHRGAVAYGRKHPLEDSIVRQVIQAAEQFGLLEDYPSPQGGFLDTEQGNGKTRMSRLLPTERIYEMNTIDPRELFGSTEVNLVILRRRHSTEEIPYDADHPTAAHYRKRLQRINRVNGMYSILYRTYDAEEGRYRDWRRITPEHYASFTDDFDHHGRIYTGEFGHQNLRKVERQTILFDDEPSCELDYVGFHTRMLYHREGIDYQQDPYALWGKKTTKEKRCMVKILTNALINAESIEKAISACNLQMSNFDEKGNRKTGKPLEEAWKLREMVRKAKTSFKQLTPLVLEYHRPIAHLLHRDQGMVLMRQDGKLALDILSHFARKGIPCLGCHDSFIVPRFAAAELKQVMVAFYERRFGYLPIVEG